MFDDRVPGVATDPQVGETPTIRMIPPPGAGADAKTDPGAPANYQLESHPPLRRMPNNRGFVPTILSTAVFFISLAVAVTIATYSIGAIDAKQAGRNNFWSWWSEWSFIGAPVAGALIGLIATCAFALYNREYTQPDRIDPQLYGEIRARLGTLDATLPVLCPIIGSVHCEHQSRIDCVISCNEAWARRDFINDELGSRGSRWVLGSGYVDLYRNLHAAEEALFTIEPATKVVGSALFDELRLKGADSVVPNAESLRTDLRAALPWVSGMGIQFVPPADLLFDSPFSEQEAPTADEQVLGRTVLRNVRRAINEFRDGERANLVRARNQLIWTGTITALAGYALLVLAVLSKAPPEAVLSGVVYYVVGAGVGLFRQLNTDKDQDRGQEDFGFARASLFYVPVLSGLAAVGGVLLVALLAEAANFGAEPTDQSLKDVFDVRAFSLGLVIAAVFGLTPSLLLDRLQAKTNEYREALNLTTATAGGATLNP